MAKNRRRPHAVGLASIPKELQPLAKRAWQNGVTIEVRPSNHLLWKWPSGQVLRTSASPSDSNVVHQVLRTIRKRGLPLC